jgi:hypothetical protein
VGVKRISVDEVSKDRGTSFTSSATILPSINAFVDSPRQPGGANGGANKPLTRQVAVTPMPGPGLEPGRGCPQEILRGLGRWDLGGLQREKITEGPGEPAETWGLGCNGGCNHACVGNAVLSLQLRLRTLLL